MQRVLPRVRADLAVLHEADVAGADLAQPVVDRTLRAGRGEAVAVPDQPACEIAAVATAQHAEPFGVHPGDLCERIDTRQEVLIVEHAGIAIDGLGEVLAVAGAAAEVDKEDAEPDARLYLELIEEAVAVLCV